MIANTEDRSRRERAAQLVDAASVYGLSAYVPFSKKHGIVLRIPTAKWDWVFTVAGVFMAATWLQSTGIPDQEQDALMDMVSERLAAWHADGSRGFDDCKASFERTYDMLAEMQEYQTDERFLASDSVGLWMSLNLLGRLPQTDAEQDLARAAGVAVVHTFHHWWDAV